MRMLEKRLLRKIFGSRKDEGTGYEYSGKLYNEELCNLYSLPVMYNVYKYIILD
jgi:hypothetical protein